jgi:hypothetical protein
MTMWLKQSTAVTIKLGPFVDDADGKTAETSLTIAQADIRLSKNGGNIAQSNNSAGATHDELGYYDVPLNTTDTNTLGTLKVLVSESGALPVWQDFMVVTANVWDTLFGADQLLVEVDVVDAGSLTAIADAVLDEALTEPSSVYAWGSATLRNVVAWMGALSRNKITQSSSQSTLRNDADNATLSTSSISEAGGTFTRGEWS